MNATLRWDVKDGPPEGWRELDGGRITPEINWRLLLTVWFFALPFPTSQPPLETAGVCVSTHELRHMCQEPQVRSDSQISRRTSASCGL